MWGWMYSLDKPYCNQGNRNVVVSHYVMCLPSQCVWRMPSDRPRIPSRILVHALLTTCKWSVICLKFKILKVCWCAWVLRAGGCNWSLQRRIRAIPLKAYDAFQTEQCEQNYHRCSYKQRSTEVNTCKHTCKHSHTATCALCSSSHIVENQLFLLASFHWGLFSTFSTSAYQSRQLEWWIICKSASVRA